MCDKNVVIAVYMTKMSFNYLRQKCRKNDKFVVVVYIEVTFCYLYADYMVTFCYYITM